MVFGLIWFYFCLLDFLRFSLSSSILEDILSCKSREDIVASIHQRLQELGEELRSPVRLLFFLFFSSIEACFGYDWIFIYSIFFCDDRE